MLFRLAQQGGNGGITENRAVPLLGEIVWGALDAPDANGEVRLLEHSPNVVTVREAEMSASNQGAGPVVVIVPWIDSTINPKWILEDAVHAGA